MLTANYSAIIFAETNHQSGTHLIESGQGDSTDLQVVVLDDKFWSTADGKFDGLGRKDIPQTGDNISRVRERFLLFSKAEEQRKYGRTKNKLTCWTR